MLSFGVLLGTALVVLVILVALALGRKAADGVARFRAERHERFVGQRGT